MKDDSVYYVSEHRGSYGNKEEIKDINKKILMSLFFRYLLQDLRQLKQKY